MTVMRHVLFILAASMFGQLAFAAQAHADTFVSNGICSNYAGLTNHIAGCIRATLDSATGAYFNPQTGVYHYVARAITGLMIISVAIYGAMAAFGAVEKVGRDSIMLLLKLAMVSYFATNCDYMYHTVTAAMDAISQDVVGFVPTSGKADNTGLDFSQITCLKKMAVTDPSKAGITGPWLAMDCMLDSVIGIKMDAVTSINANGAPTAAGLQSQYQEAYNGNLSAKDTGLSRGLFYFFFSTFNTSILGVLIAIIGFIFIWGMVQLIIKALFIYIAGYLGIAVMMIIAPLFIPLVLFQATRSYFDAWVKLVISFALQPVVILAFIVFNIAAVDLATFSGNYSIMYRIAGDESRKANFSLNQYLSCPRDVTNPHTCLAASTPVDGKTVDTIIQEKQLEIAQIKTNAPATAGFLDNMGSNPIANISSTNCTAAAMEDPKVKKICDQNYPILIPRKNLNWGLLAAARSPAVVVVPDPQVTPKETVTPGEQAQREVIAACLFAAIVVFVMNELLKVVPSIANDLLGDFAQSPNLAKVAQPPGKKSVTGTLKGFANKLGGGG